MHVWLYASSAAAITINIHTHTRTHTYTHNTPSFYHPVLQIALDELEDTRLAKNRFTYFLRLQRLVTLSINMVDASGQGGGEDSMELGAEEDEGDGVDECGEYDERQLAACQDTDTNWGSGMVESGSGEIGSGSGFGEEAEGGAAAGQQRAVDRVVALFTSWSDSDSDYSDGDCSDSD